jgi:CRP-like cAMP-binding protein
MIIVDGVAVVRRNGRKIATLGAGDIMGELSILSGLPRTATVVADTDLIVESLNRREFMSLLDDSPRIAKKILLRAITSLHDLATSHVS